LSNDLDELQSILGELEKDTDASSRASISDVAEMSRRRLCLELREQRNRLDVSQVEMARRIGTSQPAVARLELGLADPKLSTLARCAAALGFELHFNWQPIGQRSTQNARETVGV